MFPLIPATTRALTLLFFFASITAAQNQGPPKKRESPVDLVNVFTGTSNSRWMLFPGPTVPMGLVKLSPDNQGNVWNGGYEYTIASISGFSFLHSFGLSSMSVMPLVGELENEPGQPKLFPGPSDGPFAGMWSAGYRSRIRKDTEHGKPGYYSVDLIDAKTQVELTATARTGWMRFHFPKNNPAHLIFDFFPPAEEQPQLVKFHVERVSPTEIAGFLTQRNQYAGEFTVYFVAQLSKPFRSMNAWRNGPYKGDDSNYGTGWRIPREIEKDIHEITSSQPGGIWLDLDTDDTQLVALRTGISLVGLAQAKQNLETESKPHGFNFDSVAAAASATWNKLLQRIEVEGGSPDDHVKLYTNLYRAHAAKAMLDDVDGSYRNACGEVQNIAAPADHMYSSDSMWGTQWDLSPLWSLISPEIATSYINFMTLEAARDGWLPQAPVNLRYGPVMVAQHEVAMITGAWQKGIRGFDVNSAYAAVKKVLTTPGEPFTCGGRYPQGFAGNRHLAAFLDKGYVPEETGAASTTFEYSYDEACGAVLAESLGKRDDAELMKKASTNWRNTLSPVTGYAQRRHADGTWFEPADLHRFGTIGGWEGRGFVEGTAWIYSWFVPQDVPALVQRLGADVFNQRLEEGFEKNYVDLTNEPNLQAPWLFNYSGRPELTQKHAREVFSRVFDTSPLNGWPGEEDEGQMGAYVVLAGIGLFDMEGGCTHTPRYQISGPAFSRVVLHLQGGDFEIISHNNGPNNVHIRSAKLNGNPMSALQIEHAGVARGGKLELEMASEPPAAGTQPGAPK